MEEKPAPEDILRKGALEDKPLLPRKSEIFEIPKDQGRKIPYLRFLILCLGVCSAAAPVSCYFAFTFAVACNNPPGLNRSGLYNSNPEKSPIIYYDGVQESIAFSAYSIGNLMMLPVLPFIKFADVRTQVFIDFFTELLALQRFPLLGHLCAHWAPKKEIGLFVGAITCYSQFAIFFTMTVSGVTCEYGGWRPIFYLHGGITIGLAMLWIVFFHDFPHKHPHLANKEYMLIHTGQREVHAVPDVPKKKLLAHRGIVAVIIAAIGNYNGISPLIVYCSLLMRKGLGSSEIEISSYVATCFAVQAFFKITSGIVSDKLKVFSEKNRLRLFNSLSCGLSGVLMIGTAMLDPKEKILCSIMLTLTQSIIGFNSAGFNRAAIIVSGKYASFIMTIIGVIIALSTIIEPFVVAAVAPEHTWSQWFPLLVVHGAILVISNFLFCLLTDGKPFHEE
ncbi:unnamed protein product, partial [Mesorhabditis spiculigera]